MAIKTFSVNEVLTASDTNTFLANAGLVYVKSQTVGSSVGVSGVVIADAFSSTYDHYLIHYSGGTASATVNLRIQLGSTVSGYKYALTYNTFSGSTFADGSPSGASFVYAGSAGTSWSFLKCHIYNPNKAENTLFESDIYEVPNYVGKAYAVLPNTTQYTSFTLFPNTGTISGGVVTVYGYRKA